MCHKRSPGYFGWSIIQRMSQAIESGSSAILAFSNYIVTTFCSTCIFGSYLYDWCLLVHLICSKFWLSEQEIDLLSRLSHVNIVQYYGSDLVWVYFMLFRIISLCVILFCILDIIILIRLAFCLYTMKLHQLYRRKRNWNRVNYTMKCCVSSTSS